jgi:hypothetical protein
MMKRGTRVAILSGLIILSTLGFGGNVKSAVVVFPDPALEGVIRELIGIPVGDIDELDLEVIDTLLAPDLGIVNISGVGKCVNLEVLDLSGNAVTDISELADLRNLTILNLAENGLDDIGPIANLPTLTSLTLSYNKFLNAALDGVLGSLVNLEYLDLSGNHLTNMGGITNLPNLASLYLADNQISDISGLRNCGKLSYLNLYKNKITDISVLAELDNLQVVDLCSNDIVDFSPLADVPTVLCRDTDSDDDNILDTWETEHFGDLSHDGQGDTDGDRLSDLREYQRGTDPNNPDTDGDGMPDGWEVANRLNPMVNDAHEDPDQDGISNGQEYLSGTDPMRFTAAPIKPTEQPTANTGAHWDASGDGGGNGGGGDSGGGSGGGNCFIATISLDSSVEGEGKTLCAFHDSSLMPDWISTQVGDTPTLLFILLSAPVFSLTLEAFRRKLKK